MTFNMNKTERMVLIGRSFPSMSKEIWEKLESRLLRRVLTMTLGSPGWTPETSVDVY
jgi:hypothetical protein